MKFNKKVNRILSEKSSGKEYIIWGIPPDQNSEVVLMTKFKDKTITDKKTADKLVKLITNKYGATKVRVQEIDMNNFDWAQEIGM